MRFINKKELWLILVLFILVIIFLKGIIFTHTTFIDRVYSRYFYPIRFFGAQSIKANIFPLWNPYQFCGLPFLANPQSALLHPLSIIIYLLPFELGIKLFIVTQTFLGGLFMYLLMKEFRLSSISCFVSSVVFIFNGYFLSVDILSGTTSIIFSPLIFLFFNRSLANKNFWAGILCGIMLGLQFLGGEPAVIYTTGLVLSLFTITKFSSPKTFPILFIPFLLGISLFLFQLLPFIELIINSDRAENVVLHECLSFYELLGFIFPMSPGIFREPLLFWIGQDWLKSNYLGVVSFSLALVGILSKRGIFWTIVFSISILISLGILPLPLLEIIRFPVRFFCLTIFSLAILVGFGLEKILNKDKKTLLIISIFGIIYTIFLLIGILFHEGIITTLWKRYFVDSDINNMRSEYLEIIKNSILSFLFLGGGILLISLYKKFPLSIIGLIFIIILEAFVFTYNLNPLINEEFYRYEPGVVKFLKENKGIYRITRTPDLDKLAEKYYYVFQGSLLQGRIRKLQDYLTPNFGLMHNIFDISGYSALRIRDYMDFFWVFNQRLLSACPHILDLLNVRYVIAGNNINSPNLKLVYKNQGVMLYENKSFLPRAFLVQKAVCIKDKQKVIEKLSTPKFNPREEIILEEEIQNPKSKVRNLNSKLQIIDYQPNKVVINTFSPTNCFLFLSDTYYPGWRAYIDNKITKIYRANLIFRALYLPSGNHIIRFEYLPASFLVGMIVSIIIGVMLLFLLIFHLWQLKSLHKLLL